MKRRWALAAPMLLLTASSCWAALGLSDKEYTLGGGGSGAAGGDPHADMVKIDHADKTFYIDATEVTNQQYWAWLAENPSPNPSAANDSRCGWNDSLVPGAVYGGCAAPVETDCDADLSGDATIAPQNPVHCVDWCDAEAYCKAHGKRMCGGPHGAAIVLQMETAFAVPDSEWFFACSGPSMNAYPYGPTVDASACNDNFDGIGMVVDVASSKGCEGGFPGIFDMSGNVDEWVDACYPAVAGAPVNCVRAGGAFYSDGTMGNPPPTCDGTTTLDACGQSHTTGFRCCAD